MVTVALTYPVSVVHEGVKNFQCTFCDYRCGWASNLKKHIDTVHEGTQNHTCDTCGKAFNRLYNLKQHMKRGFLTLCLY